MWSALVSSGGTLRRGFSTRRRAPDGHVVTHRPQPMHRSRSTCIFPSPAASPSKSASIWHRVWHTPHASQRSASTSAWKLELKYSAGFGKRFADVSTAQQQPQQQHTNSGFLVFSGCSTRPSLSAASRRSRSEERRVG